MIAPSETDGAPAPAPPARTDITRIVLLVLVLGMMIGGSFWILRPFLPPLIWATMIVVATWPVMQNVERLLWRRRSLAVTVMTTAFLLLVVVPLILAVSSLVDYVPDLGEQFKELSSLQIPAPPDWVAQLPLVGTKLATEWQNVVNRGPEGLAAQLAPYAKVISSWLLAEAGNLGMVAVQLMLTIALTAVLYAYRRVRRPCRRPFRRPARRRARRVVGRARGPVDPRRRARHHRHGHGADGARRHRPRRRRRAVRRRC